MEREHGGRTPPPSGLVSPETRGEAPTGELGLWIAADPASRAHHAHNERIADIGGQQEAEAMQVRVCLRVFDCLSLTACLALCVCVCVRVCVCVFDCFLVQTNCTKL